jgi:hypothetical protein
VLDSDLEDTDRWLRLVNREVRLGKLALLIESTDSLGSQLAARLAWWTEHIDAILFVDCRQHQPFLTSDCSIDINKPTPGEQRQAWQSMLPELLDTECGSLATQFCMNVPQIGAIVADQTPGTSGNQFQATWSACRRVVQPRLDDLAQRIEVKATWDDLVLPAESKELLHRMANQVRHRSRVLDDWGFRDKMNRGFGTTALFAGESGTGKTMAAEVIADELDLDLYRVDLSTVISKYIGECEKSLSRIYDAAEDCGVVLFFDEMRCSAAAAK